tara:strand:- start:1662 stop:2588 length:927 start_codon:yes stop_codon:yes gene_type:complete
MNILVTSAVHENPLTLRDQALNYAVKLPEALMVVHVSASSVVPLCEFEQALSGLDNVVLNPNRMPTVWGDMLGVHISNLKYASSCLGQFDRFCFASSQDMLFRDGLGGRMSCFDAGYDYGNEFRENKLGGVEEIVIADLDFAEMRRNEGVQKIVWSQIDGAFFPWDFAVDLSQRCEKYLDLSSSKLGYFREEIVIPTLFNAFYPDSKICYPYILKTNVFSIWADELLEPYVPVPLIRRAMVKAFRFRYPRCVTKRLYKDMCAGNNKYLKKYEHSRGGRRFDLDGVYGLKRISSDLSDPVRVAIRESKE